MDKNYLKNFTKFADRASLETSHISSIYRGKTVKTSYGAFENY